MRPRDNEEMAKIITSLLLHIQIKEVYLMRKKFVFNYLDKGKPKRLVIDRDQPLSSEIVAAMLVLHAEGIIELDNVLSIKEAC